MYDWLTKMPVDVKEDTVKQVACVKMARKTTVWTNIWFKRKLHIYV